MVAKKTARSGKKDQRRDTTGPLRPMLFLLQVLGEESAHRVRDLPAMSFQGEMTRIEQPNFCARNVATECLRAGGEKTSVVLTPDREQWRPARAQEFLILRILLDIGSIICKQVELELVIAGARQQGVVERIAFRRDQRSVCLGDPAEVSPLIGGRRETRAQRIA